jgi:adenine-specific DNA-methyltransferase
MPTSYKHSDKTRPNIPAAGMAVKDDDIEKEKISYRYDPHLSPVLRFDETGEADRLSEQVEAILDKAKSEPLTPEETQLLQDALLRSRQPWLEWSTKHEKSQFEVDPLALHIHEKVSARAILKTAERTDIDEDLFSTQRLDREQERQFYQHDVDWANRLILGDSLQVMTSLSRREGLAGKVQMIYIDPPYGIKFSSNWQNEVGKRDVGAKNEDLTREPEMIKAYRDTWTLGVHSYLDYLKQRLIAAKELLTDSGSVFVQISDENLHRVRSIMDDVLGTENFCSIITLVKTAGQNTKLVASVCDYLIWFSKDISKTKFRQPYRQKKTSVGDIGHYKWIISSNGERSALNSRQMTGVETIPEEVDFYAPTSLISQGASKSDDGNFDYLNKHYHCGAGNHWKTNPEGRKRLALANRVHVAENSIRFIRRLSDFPVIPHANFWDDTATGNFTEQKVYVVQTAGKIIERCIQMTTDPGDLVLDPTCGSGTTAYVAEQWGRRWITVDSSRVAAVIARQRLLTAKFETYKTKDESEGINPTSPKNPGTGFVYKTVPHITLKSIAQNKSLDAIFEKHEAILLDKLKILNDTLAQVEDTTKAALILKLIEKHKREGSTAVTDADERRWMLPGCDASTIKPFTANAASRAEGFSKNITAGQVKAYKAFAAEIESESWEEWQVPFDANLDWPQVLQDGLADYRKAWRVKMNEVNACIEANATQEELVDQPEIVRGVTRVSGPFTVESIRPLENSMKGRAKITGDSPIGGAPEQLETFGDREINEDGNDFSDTDVSSSNATSHIDRMLSLLRSDGLTFPGNKHISFEGDLHPIDSEFLHAEASYIPEAGVEARSVGIVIGPEHGAVTAFQASSAIFQAIGRKYDELFFAGFAFDSVAQDKIQEANDNDASGLTVHLCMIRPDVLTEGLKRNEKGKSKTAQASQQIFTVFGQPRTRLEKTADGDTIVHMEGVDVYDPVKNELIDTKANKVAAWFLDTNYDGKTFCICQAFFPDKNSWGKLAKALKEDNSDDGSRFATVLEKMSGQSSLPFTPGSYKRVAVKVIDPRGNEVLRVHELNS